MGRHKRKVRDYYVDCPDCGATLGAGGGKHGLAFHRCIDPAMVARGVWIIDAGLQLAGELADAEERSAAACKMLAKADEEYEVVMVERDDARAEVARLREGGGS